MHPTKSQRRGKNRDIARLQAVHRLSVAVKSDKFVVLGHIHHVAALAFQCVIAVAKFAFEDVRHGHQLDRPLLAGVQSILRRTTAAPAAADQDHLNHFASGGMDMGNGHSRQRRGGGDAAGGFDKFATCRGTVGRFVHNTYSRDDLAPMSIQEIHANAGK